MPPSHLHKSPLVPLALCTSLLFLPALARAQDRKIPPPGIVLPETDRAELRTKLSELDSLVVRLRQMPAASDLLPDVLIFQKAVAWGMDDNTIYNDREIASAKEQLAEGIARANALLVGKSPWASQTGLVVRGYISKIDGSVQPYGLVVPPEYTPGDTTKRRLDLFLHGRGETLTELAFLRDRTRNAGEFTPPGAFVLHPYGRFCNANRFAGEVDVFESLADVKRRYKINENAVVLRGFSMGGNSVWHLATQHPDAWTVASPGAGFSETAEFLNAFAAGKTPPPWYVQTLWHLYDAIDYAANLTQLPLVAYNGDKDGQKQAADRMEDALKAENMTLTRVIGVNMGHGYTAEGKTAINQFVDAAVTANTSGQKNIPTAVRFTTWTLRWNKTAWLTVDGLENHWQRARVDANTRFTQPGMMGEQKMSQAEYDAMRNSRDYLYIKTENVAALTVAPPQSPKKIRIDGQTLNVSASVAPLHLQKNNNKWQITRTAAMNGIRKTHGLQGPIDDAFMDAFLFVKPTGTPQTSGAGNLASAALALAQADWHRYFRGDAPTRDDVVVTAADIRDKNLVLWGDAGSNKLIARIIRQLPIKWDAKTLVVNGKSYPADTVLPALVFPNPLNPKRYVVLNSGFTFHKYGSDNNARQAPYLPDWAVLDAQGEPLDAGFFDESWRIKPMPPTKP